MTTRRQKPEAHAFRYVGYFFLAVILLCLEPTARSAWQLLLGVSCCVTWPVVAHWLERSRSANPSINVVECGVSGVVAGVVSLPLLPLAALGAALLAGAAAQGGRRYLWPSIPALIIGVVTGFWMTDNPVAHAIFSDSTRLADLLSVALIVIYTVLLSEFSFRQAMRLYESKSRHQVRSVHAAQVSARLARYIPRELHQRLEKQPHERCALERCWLTVVFIDVVGFTELTEHLAAEALNAVLNDYLAMLETLVEARHGTLGKLLGDGVLVFFKADSAEEKSVVGQSSVALCLAVQQGLCLLSRRWTAQGYLVSLATRTGIASGFCTLGDWGGDGRLDYTVIGSPVNLASRLQARAASDGILVCSATAAILKPGLPSPVKLEGPLLTPLKGFGEVQTFRLVDTR
ncbi:MAG: adenylate/guanylate cyclase domain-containing protein [Gammaproteobacteria bacterium]|nr:adenylate/guanylate cyclase domain-containing protein [Gammaproteobacteria bacterium]